MPVKYTVDPGPMSSNAGKVVVDNATGLQRVAQMFQSWQNVPTAALSYSYAGTILAAGGYVKGADVTSAAQFNAVSGSCQSAQQNPVVFDADGSLMTALGVDSDVIGFTSICATNATTGHITGAMITLNGAWLNGARPVLTDSQFADAITHEMGHFAGLDHSQINVDVLQNFSCDLDTMAGLPLMFPILVCPGRSESGLPVIPSDDAAWISHFYPGPTYASTYGLITARSTFPTPAGAAQGVNVVVRAVDDPQHAAGRIATRNVFRSVGAVLHEQHPGQTSRRQQAGVALGSKSATPDRLLRNLRSSRHVHGTGRVNQQLFCRRLQRGPTNPPVPNPGQDEYWKQNESAYDIPLQSLTHYGQRRTKPSPTSTSS